MSFASMAKALCVLCVYRLNLRQKKSLVLSIKKMLNKTPCIPNTNSLLNNIAIIYKTCNHL